MKNYADLKFRDDRFSIMVSEETFSLLLAGLYDELGIETELRTKSDVKHNVLRTLGEYFLYYLSFKNNPSEVFEMLKQNGFVLEDIENLVSEDLLGMIRDYVDSAFADSNFRTEAIYTVVSIPDVGIVLKSGENIWKYLYNKMKDGNVEE